MATFSRAFLAASLVAVAAAGAQERPESILPPGFGDPPPPSATPTAPPATPATGLPAIQPPPSPEASPSPSPTPTASPTPIDPETLARYEMPLFARRSLDDVGVARDVGPDAFGGADGGYIHALMRRTAAPPPSRWLHIALRRALVSRLRPPRGVNGADFAAERAWLLLRMGESTAARAIVQGVDAANYTTKLHQVAMNAMLATGDPAGLCPLADAGLEATGQAGWALAQPMCAALAGDGARARTLFRAARRRRLADGVDLRLAEKVVGAGGQGRQAVTIEWDAVDRLTVWRFGLATATGVAVPDALYETTGRQVTYWRALAPGVPLVDRIAAAEAAAAQGVLSSAALVDLYGAVDAEDDAPSAAAGAAQDLRAAYVGQDAGTRLTALRQLWGGGVLDYGRLVLTARAAVRQPVSAENADRDRIVASMLSAGMDRTAQRWSGAVPVGGDAWAMLALADPDAGRFGYGAVSGYETSPLKQRLFFAGLAGLGRLAREDVESGAESLEIPIGAANSWTRALDRAVAADQPGTVLVLAAVGMQTPSWRGVPPAALYRIVAALRAVGLEGEARMIAVEAITRA